MKYCCSIILMVAGFLSWGQVEVSQRIDSILETVVEPGRSPGLSVGVVKDGRIIYQNSKGMMNLEYGLPFNDSTVFGLASVTKQFTSACLAILAKAGKLTLEDDVRKYIPELAFYGDTIRVRHLLNHTSGIRNHNVLLDLKGFDYEHEGYTNEMIERLMFRQNGVNNAPGEKMLYSNTNYVLLALIVKRVSGMEIHEFARQELFDPLGMTSTRYKNDLNDVINNRAYSYYKEGKIYKQPKTVTLCVGAGGMMSTIQDLAIWSQVFLSPEDEFSYLSDFITELDTLTDGTRLKHARGMFVSPYRGYSTFNHSGRDIGMRSQFICLPGLDLAVVVYANSEHVNAVDISYQILDLLIPEQDEVILAQEQYRHRRRELESFKGHYRELNSDMTMHIFVRGDTLQAMSSFGRAPVPLKSFTPSSFCRFDNPSVVHTFFSEGTSYADMWVDFGGAIFYFERYDPSPNPNMNIDEFIGKYYSEELDVLYELKISDNKLTLSYPNNKNIVLTEGETDVFGSNKRTKYTFTRDAENSVISFSVASEGTVKDIEFVLVN